MSIPNELDHMVKITDSIDAEVRKAAVLSDADAQLIVGTMQIIEDKLATLLGDFGVEIGDERVD